MELFCTLSVLLAQKDSSTCLFTDSGSDAILNLSSLTGTKISGGTSSFNKYDYSVCSDGYKCNTKGCMINKVSKQDDSCQCLMRWDDGGTIPTYFASQKTWEFQYYSSDFFTRVWWICNETSIPYSIRFTGAEADGEYGYYVESYLACVESNTTNTMITAKEKLIFKKLKQSINTNYNYNNNYNNVGSCSNMGDCSYNGNCTNNNECVCFAQWTGKHCATLNFLATPKDNGLQTIIDGQRVSSWGGSVIRDDNGTYWMYAAEMGYFCGINVWLSNSIVVMARANKFDSNGK